MASHSAPSGPFLASLWVALQPVVNLVTGEVVGHEALVRGPRSSAWRTPQAIFKKGRDLGIEVQLEMTCRSLALDADGSLPEGPVLFMNVDLGYPALAWDLPTSGTPLALEITEEHPILGDTRALEQIKSWREAGLTIVLNDYGAGHASMGLLLAIQPHIIKLDHFIIAGLDHDAKRLRAVDALAGLARDSGMQLIAEGIEQPGELAAPVDLGVSLGQGYLLGRPARRPVPGPSKAVLRRHPAGSRRRRYQRTRRPRSWPLFRGPL